MPATHFLPRSSLSQLYDTLSNKGYRVVGPKVDLGAITYTELGSFDELPVGVQEKQAPGSYQLSHTGGVRNFSWANGHSAIKPYVYASTETLWQVSETDNGFVFKPGEPNAPLTAIIGVRACDIAALRIQDQHFLHNTYRDEYYAERREKLFLVGVNCSHCADTCFCESTGDGPEILDGYDLLLDELEEGFLIRAGSDEGTTIVNTLATTEASSLQLDEAERQIKSVAASQSTKLLHEDLHAKLLTQLDNPIWDEIAERCLSCGNCTAVCPTCFCHREVEKPELDGKSSSHYREWDSCFNQDHSYIVGEVVRENTKLRYRQWMTHKLATWVEQYDRIGCVGCGRCTTWCPAQIDFVREATRIVGPELLDDNQ